MWKVIVFLLINGYEAWTFQKFLLRLKFKGKKVWVMITAYYLLKLSGRVFVNILFHFLL